jgi:hypothetical protein
LVPGAPVQLHEPYQSWSFAKALKFFLRIGLLPFFCQLKDWALFGFRYAEC